MAMAEKIKKENAATARWEAEAAERAQAGGWGQAGSQNGGGGNGGDSGRGGSRGGSRGASRGGYGEFSEDADIVIDNSTIYDQAERISSPRIIDDGADIPQYVNRKVVRQVEVPFKRQVKVPVKTRKIVPTRVQKKVKTTKLVEVPAFKMVDETFTEMIEQPAIRNKEVWVKKIVPEKYMERVPVQRSRKVKVPTTVIQEVDGYEIVEVGGSKTVEVDGFRVDEVDDTKVVEVEEMQRYRLRPEPDGPARIDATRDIGRGQRSSYSNRRMGSQVYHANDERIRDVDVDNTASDVAGLAITSSYARPTSSSRGRRGQQGGRARPASAPANRGYSTSYKAPRGSQHRRPLPVGFKLSNTHDSNCILVTAVNPGSPAMQAGVRKGDLVYYCNNRPTRNLEEFRRVMGSVVGNLQVSVKRLGGTKLQLNIVR